MTLRSVSFAIRPTSINALRWNRTVLTCRPHRSASSLAAIDSAAARKASNS